MPPAISPRSQVGCPLPTVRTQRSGYLRDVELSQGCLDDHLTGKFHPLCAQAQFENRLAIKAAHSTMKVPDGGRKQGASNEGKHGIAEITVQRRHGTGHDAALEAIADYQFGSTS